MQERQVTIGSETYKLQEPFLVLATQNPIEQEGTYPLPEAQVDRFLLKVKIGYPDKNEEREILRRSLQHREDDTSTVQKVVNIEQLLKARKVLSKIYLDEKVEKYIIDLVFATRQPADYQLKGLVPLISFGASPRATIALGHAAKAVAFLRRRGYVTPEDVRYICYDVLRHRIGLTYEAEAENITQEDIITKILGSVQVP